MDRRIATALTVGMVLGAGGTVATRDGTIAGAIGGADIVLYEDRIQMLSDGGCSVYAQAAHKPDAGLVVVHVPREYPLGAKLCAAARKDCSLKDCYEQRTQFLASGGCSAYSVDAKGQQSVETGQSAAACTAAKTRAAKAAMRDFEKSSEAP